MKKDILNDAWDRVYREPKQELPLWLPVAVLIICSIILFAVFAHADCTGECQEVAKVLAAESANQTEIGMQGVANVIANRARRSGATPYQIIARSHQFSGYTAKNKEKLYRQVKATADKLALNIMNLPDITNGATHYFNPKLCNPSWAKSMTKVWEYKDHVFYK